MICLMVTGSKRYLCGLRLLLITSVPFAAANAGVPLRLDLTPGGGFDVNYAFSTGHATNGRDVLSGHMLGTIEINPAGEVISLALTGGRIAHQNTVLTIPLSTSFFGIVTKVTISLEGVVSRIVTNRGPGYVDQTSGNLFNPDHRMISNEGTITTRYLVGTVLLDQETRNLATQPDDTPLVGTSTVAATLLGQTGLWKRYRIDFHHVRNEVRTQPVSGIPTLPTGTTLTIQEEGEFSASGEVLIPGEDFVAWAATSRGVSVGGFDQLDPQTGQPLLVMYALGADEGAWTLPVILDAGSGHLRMQLPDSLRAPVVWEYSASLAPGSWQALAGGRLEQGTQGEQVIPLPPGGRAFVRAYVPVP
jgi:hypothetical protein